MGSLAAKEKKSHSDVVNPFTFHLKRERDKGTQIQFKVQFERQRHTETEAD